MKTISSDLVYDSGLLNQHPHILIFGVTPEDILARIIQRNLEIEIAEKCCVYDVKTGYIDIRVDHEFDVIFDIENLDSYVETPVFVRAVFALGYKSIDELPATWGVCALLEFPDGKPSILSGLEHKKRFFMSSKKMWSDLIDLYH